MKIYKHTLMIFLLGIATIGVIETEAAERTFKDLDGKHYFEQHCALCHRGVGPGVFMLQRRLGERGAILENRDQISADYLQQVVRLGIGSMPRFSRGELTDYELVEIVEYLTKKTN